MTEIAFSVILVAVLVFVFFDYRASKRLEERIREARREQKEELRRRIVAHVLDSQIYMARLMRKVKKEGKK